MPDAYVRNTDHNGVTDMTGDLWILSCGCVVDTLVSRCAKHRFLVNAERPTYAIICLDCKSFRRYERNALQSAMTRASGHAGRTRHKVEVRRYADRTVLHTVTPTPLPTGDTPDF